MTGNQCARRIALQAWLAGRPAEGNSGWFGWFKDETIEQLTEQWLLADTEAQRDQLIDAIQIQAFQQVPTVPLGQFQLYNAYRRNVTNVVEAFGALFWNIRRT